MKRLESELEPHTEVQSLRAMLERHDPVTVLDVRPASERAEGSIPGSIHLDAYEDLRPIYGGGTVISFSFGYAF